MAEVLGVGAMNVSVFERMVYKDVYENVDLIVSIVDGEIDFAFSEILSDDNVELKFEVIGDNLFYDQNEQGLDLSQSDKKIAKLKSRDIAINSGVAKSKGSSFSFRYLHYANQL